MALTGKTFYCKRDDRSVIVIGRCQPRELQWCPVVWEVENIKTGRTTYVGDRTLRKDYREAAPEALAPSADGLGSTQPEATTPQESR